MTLQDRKTLSKTVHNGILTSWPSAKENFRIHAIFSSNVGKLARFDAIMGKTSAVFLFKPHKKYINNNLRVLP